MKTSKSYALVLICLLGAPLFAFARTDEESYVTESKNSPEIPVPISVVAPDVTESDTGKTVTAEFEVDQTGRPSEIRIISGSNDPDLRGAVIYAIGRWRFRPATVNGKPVSRVVVVPFRFVKGDRSDSFVPDFVRMEHRKS